MGRCFRWAESSLSLFVQTSFNGYAYLAPVGAEMPLFEPEPQRPAKPESDEEEDFG